MPPGAPRVRLRVAPELRFMLRPDRRGGDFEVAVTATDTVGHVVQMVGVPLTEVGSLQLGHVVVTASTPLSWSGGGIPTIEVAPALRPQRTRETPPRFLLDVHLGSLTRRLRLLGLDAAYEIDADDDHLVDRALQEGRVLLTRDRGLLSRTALAEGALVRGSRTEEQLDDVLSRFAPPLAPWTRCVRCNGLLEPVDPAEVADDLEPGTRRSYRIFVRCSGCGRVYWRGAHSGPLESVVRHAEAVVAAARGAPSGREGGAVRAEPPPGPASPPPARPDPPS